MNTAIHIGGTTPEAVRELRSAIHDILQSGAEQKTLRAALEALSNGVRTTVKGAHISDCSFMIDPPKPLVKTRGAK